MCRNSTFHTAQDPQVNEAEIDVFLELHCFLHDPTNVGNFISGSSALSKPNLYIWKFSIHILLTLSLNDFKHYLSSMWNVHNCTVVWTFLGIAFFAIAIKTDLFQSCGHCWVFEIFWYSTLTASSFFSFFKKFYLFLLENNCNFVMVFAIHQYESVIIYMVYLYNLHPESPSPPHPSRLSQSASFVCPASYIKLGLVICFIYGNVFVSLLFSQIILPSPPTESRSIFFRSLSPLLPFM